MVDERQIKRDTYRANCKTKEKTRKHTPAQRLKVWILIEDNHLADQCFAQMIVGDSCHHGLGERWLGDGLRDFAQLRWGRRQHWHIGFGLFHSHRDRWAVGHVRSSVADSMLNADGWIASLDEMNGNHGLEVFAGQRSWWRLSLLMVGGLDACAEFVGVKSERDEETHVGTHTQRERWW